MSTETGNRPDVRKGWLTDVLIGGIPGAIVGAVAAVNVVLFAGIERGYEATIPEVFRASVLVGSVVVAILVGGPVVGVWIARRIRRQRTSGRNHG